MIHCSDMGCCLGLWGERSLQEKGLEQAERSGKALALILLYHPTTTAKC